MSMSMSMSCSPSPSSPQHHAALDLLDDCWFFSNTLASNKPPSTSTTTTTRESIMSSKQGSGSGSVLGARKFLRTPSLPAPRRHVVVEEEEEEEVVVVDQDEEEVDDDDLNWSSIYQGVLRTRMAAERGSRSSAALQRAPSMPVVPSSSSSKSTPSMPKLRHSNSTTLARSRHQQTFQQPSSTGAIAKYQRQQQQQHRGSTSTSKKSGGFQDKKWKSSSDLESIEVQGFRDLGFVFDKEELRDSLADVLPGLKQQQQQQLEQPRRQRHHQMQSPSSGGSAVPRPYLSEAWQHVQRRPAPVRVQSSSPEMKDQLRMWAQAVACNVRHEC